MRAHIALSERTTALRLYERCVTVLREDLGVEPLPETVALVEQIRG
jgi:LuxR family transcriptional regulator, maltose regulon positive regulatory protein